MNFILLSGGMGKRLWPLSNPAQPKQFIKMFNKKDGTHESMLQRIYRKLKEKDRKANILIAASPNQVDEIYSQLGNDVKVCVEPSRRDTFPAIVLGAAYLKENMKVFDNEPVIVCPVDSFTDEQYYELLFRLNDIVEKGTKCLTLIGIEPTHPCEKYGYILPENKDQVSSVKKFMEKPNIEKAEEYIQKGAIWNGGVFAFKLEYIMKKMKEIIGYVDYTKLYKSYNSLKNVSFDYAIVEREKSVQVVRFSGIWKDIGTWDELIEEMPNDIIGKALCGECKNTYVINTSNKPIICIGLEDVIVSASSEGILIVKRHKTNDVKKIVERLN